jgi:ATP-dependent helicase/nuclease subunit B
MRGPKRTLIILPDGDRVEQALLEAAQRAGFVDGRGFTTFGRVLEWCEPAKHLKRRPCPELTARLVVSACAAKLDAGHPFGAWVKEPGFAREVCTAISQLKGQRASPEQLLHAAERLTDLPAKARGTALGQLWKMYEAGLAQLELADREDLMAAAIEVLRQGLPSAFLGFSAITVRHLYDWPPLRLELVTALARACHQSGLEFLLELPRTDDPNVDALTDEAMGSLERAGADDAAFARGVELATNPGQQTVVAQLFGDAAVHPERGPDGPESNGWAIHSFSTATAIDELREISRRVRLALDAGAVPDDIAVAFRGLDSDAEAAVAALAEKGVAARTRRGVPLGATALGRLALALPRLVEEQFPSDQVAHFLESRYVHATRTESDPEVLFRAAGVKDNLLGAQGATGAYRVRLGALAQRLRGDDAKRCEALLKDVETLIGLCAGLAKARTLGEQFKEWSELLQKLGLLDDVGGGEQIDEAAGALARAAEQALAHDQAAAQALAALGESVAQALKQSRLAKSTVSLAVFSRWLLDAAADVNLPARGVRAGAVRVLDVRELLGRRLSHVFLGGLVDGRFPSRPVTASLLSDAARGALNRSAGKPLFRLRAGEGDDRLLLREAEDRLLFVHALCAADQVTLSHPRLDAEGRNTLASPWLNALTRQLPLERLPLSAPPPLDRVHSERELRLRAGLEALSDAGTRLTRPDDAAPLLWRTLGKEPWFRAADDVARAEVERFNYFEREGTLPGPHSGGLKDKELQSILERRLAFGPKSPLSVSALKVWGNCNFAGFVEHLLGLQAPELQLEEMGTKEKGVFLHAVAEALLPRLHQAGLLGLPPGPESIARLDPHLEAALDDATQATRARTAHGNPALWQVSRAYARRAVLKVVLGKAARPFKEAEPSEVELRFGSAGAPIETAVFPAALEGETDIYLRGKIDRIDAGDGTLGVLDYKSSVKDPRDLKKEFLRSEFQLPIYLHVMRQARGVAELDAAWQSFKNGRASKLEKAVDGELDLDALLAVDAATRAELGERENLGNALHTLLRNLRAGNLGPRPLDCKWCEYERVCRISDRRLSAEDTDVP